MQDILKNKDGSIYGIKKRLIPGGADAYTNYHDISTLATVINQVLERIEELEGGRILEPVEPNNRPIRYPVIEEHSM